MSLDKLIQTLTFEVHFKGMKNHFEYIQGQPLGFDTKYLALGDRNMQVGFSLKVFWES